MRKIFVIFSLFCLGAASWVGAAIGFFQNDKSTVAARDAQKPVAPELNAKAFPAIALVRNVDATNLRTKHGGQIEESQGDGKEMLPPVGEGDGKEMLAPDGKEELPPVGERVGSPGEGLPLPGDLATREFLPPSAILSPANPRNIVPPVVSPEQR